MEQLRHQIFQCNTNCIYLFFEYRDPRLFFGQPIVCHLMCGFVCIVCHIRQVTETG